MAVEVILIMASRWFKIAGSGTSRISTVLRPIQQFARMAISSVRACRGQWLGRPLSALLLGVGAFRASFRTDHLACFQQLLEPTKGIVELTLRVRSEGCCHLLAQSAAGGAFVENNAYFGAAIARRRGIGELRRVVGQRWLSLR